MILTPVFPICIGYGSTATPTYSTDIAMSGNGWRQNNARRETPLAEYNAATNVRGQSDLDQLIEFFHAVKGQAYPFRFKDWADYKSCYVTETVSPLDQVLVQSALGGENDFALMKTYASGGLATYRTITQPLEVTVVAAIDDVPLTPGVDFTMVDGIINLTTPLTVGQKLSAGWEHELAMTFYSDKLPTVLSGYLSGNIVVPLLEFRVLIPVGAYLNGMVHTGNGQFVPYTP